MTDQAALVRDARRRCRLAAARERRRRARAPDHRPLAAARLAAVPHRRAPPDASRWSPSCSARPRRDGDLRSRSRSSASSPRSCRSPRRIGRWPSRWASSRLPAARGDRHEPASRPDRPPDVADRPLAGVRGLAARRPPLDHGRQRRHRAVDAGRRRRRDRFRRRGAGLPPRGPGVASRRPRRRDDRTRPSRGARR